MGWNYFILQAVSNFYHIDIFTQDNRLHIMYELKSEDKFTIKNRGDVYTMTLPEPLTAQDIINEMGKPVKIDDKMFTIAGVESFRPTHNKCGI